MNARRVFRNGFVFARFAVTALVGMLALVPTTAFTPVLPIVETNGRARTAGDAAPGTAAEPAPLVQRSGIALSPDRDARTRAAGPEIDASATTSTPIEMVLDDGEVEMAYGIHKDSHAYQFLWFNRFTPPAEDFPFKLTEIWVMFDNSSGETNVELGDAVHLVVYSDNDSNPTNGAALLASFAVEIQEVDGKTWTVVSLTPPVILPGPGDVLIGVIDRFVVSNVFEATYPAAFDTTAGQDRSWIAFWDTDPPDPPVLSGKVTFLYMTGEYAGNWLIRGYGEPLAPAFTHLYLPLVARSSALP